MIKREYKTRIRTHPGEFLREEFMQPLNLSAGKIAKMIGVPRNRIEKLSREQTSVTADTALRLSKLFGNSAQFWLNMQAGYDLSVTKQEVNLDSIQKLQMA